MKYEVKEKKFYEHIGIKRIVDYNYILKHLETTFELEKFLLEFKLTIENINNEVINKDFNLPIEFSTSMTEQLTANLINVDANVVEDKGINFDIYIEVSVTEISNESDNILLEKQEIKEIYQKELEEKLDYREETDDKKVEIISNREEAVNEDFFLNLRTDNVRYKVISLEDNSLDKISLKYGISMSKLCELKNSNSKLIVHDKE